MSGPRTKRQFAGAASDPAQRQITSFFPKTSTPFIESATRASAPLNGPVLPAQIQSNLINVGMRVRKAVPEGYKTGNQYSAFKLWEDDAAPVTTASSVSAIPAGGVRELLPFCGIHKVGGMDVQPVGSVAPATGGEDFSDAMSVPGLTNSQASVLSDISITSAMEAAGRAMNTNGKRRYAGDGEDEPSGAAHDGPFRLNTEIGWVDAEISPRSLAPEAGWEHNGRVLAVPKRRQGGRKPTGAAAAGASYVGQENVRIAADGNDFEEATFLDYEMDMEY